MYAIKNKNFPVLENMNKEAFPTDFLENIKEFVKIQNIYQAAIREVTTKLENLNDEFKYMKDRNPIHQIQSRVKAPQSIFEKMVRKGHPLEIKTACEKLDDIAGVRVICSYIDDIYLIADLLTSQDDIVLVSKSDYIGAPKGNGYRSLHLVIAIPVFLTDRKEMVKVEIQIRTIAMDFWASLEHELAYKMPEQDVQSIRSELKSCADVIAHTDERMQRLHEKIRA